MNAPHPTPAPRDALAVQAVQATADLVGGPCDVRAALVVAFLRGMVAGLHHGEDLSRVERETIAAELPGG